MATPYTNYTSDGTYWTGRIRDDNSLEVIRASAGTYETIESLGSYTRHGSAVAAAARLAYAQGQADAKAEVASAVQAALAAVGSEPVVVEPPDDAGTEA